MISMGNRNRNLPTELTASPSTAGQNDRQFENGETAVRDLRYFRILHDAGCCSLTDVSGHRIGFMFKGQTVQEELFLDYSNPKHGTDKLCRNVGNKLTNLRLAISQ